MSKPTMSPRSGRLLAIALSAVALAIGACSGNGGGTPPPPSQVSPLTGVPNLITYTFAPVEHGSAADTQVMGINDNGAIVGVYGSSGYSGDVKSFMSKSPYSSFTPLPYNAASTVMRSITVNTSGIHEEAGWLVHPHGLANGDFGAIDDAGNWFVVKHGNEGSKCILSKLYGINKYGIAAGYYTAEVGTGTTASCVQHDFLFFPSDSYTDNVGPPTSDSPVVTGIDNNDDIVGTATVSGEEQGWFELCKSVLTTGSSAGQCSSYYPTVYVTLNESDQPTTLTGINDSHYVVGTAGSGSGSEGFLATVSENTSGGTYTVQQYIHVGTALTVLNGINDSNDICGWYEDTGSAGYKGFVGIPESSDRRRPRAKS